MSEFFEGIIKEEKDKEFVEFASSSGVAILGIIVPYGPYRVSPRRAIFPELGSAEEFGIESFVLKAKELKINNLYLLLHSLGGGVSSAYMIARSLRKNFENIKAFIPQLAASGATLIAIAANEIVMGEISRLSPIDAQIWNGRAFRSPLALIRAFEKLAKMFEKTPREDISYPYSHLIESIDPEEFEKMIGILKEVETYAVNLLKQANYSDDEAKDIAEKLVWGFHSHYEVIDYEEAKKLKLRVTWYEKCREEWDIMRKLFGKYLLKESPIHHIVYVFPRKSDKVGGESENEGG